jgi:hypothetical protein
VLEDLITTASGANQRTWDCKLGNGVILEQNYISAHRAGEFVQHRRKQQVIALAFDVLGLGNFEQLPE